jgi:hypothetical protein
MSITKRAAACAVAAVALSAFGLAAPQASAVDGPTAKVTLAAKASAKTKSIVESNPQAAAAAATVCGAGYTQIIVAERLPDARRYATVYVYTNGTTTGPRFYDKPTCGVLHNETGSAQSMGIRLSDNYTATADDEDFGTFSTYAGPVRQNKGYCGEVYSYMKMSGRVVVDRVIRVGSCN